MWVVEVNGRSVGFVQDYRIRDYPGFALLTPDPDAIGLDYAIGEPGWAGRGLGARLLWAWMQDAHRRFPDATSYFAAPDHANAASLRILDKAGFTAGHLVRRAAARRHDRDGRRLHPRRAPRPRPGSATPCAMMCP